MGDEIENYFDPIINPDDKKEAIIGIDLGTTNSCVGIWRNNNLEIIPDIYGNRTIPSVVSFTNRSKYVGKEAKKQIELNENSFYEVKRLIGKKFDDDTVTDDKQFLTYDLVSGDDGNILIKSSLSSGKKFSPEEISSYILMELKYMAESYLDCNISKVVVTVPAYFNDSERQATKDACQIAGLDCIRIINEPTAAALAYGLDRRLKDTNIIVYDLGVGRLMFRY